MLYLNKPKRRAASIAMDAIVAIALLGSAIIALGKLSQSAGALQRQADRQLAATLAAENVLERLRGVAADEAKDRAEVAAQQVARSTGCEVRASTESFSEAGTSGVHLVVTAGPADHGSITLHDWILDTPATRQTEGNQDAD